MSDHESEAINKEEPGKTIIIVFAIAIILVFGYFYLSNRNEENRLAKEAQRKIFLATPVSLSPIIVTTDKDHAKSVFVFSFLSDASKDQVVEGLIHVIFQTESREAALLLWNEVNYDKDHKNKLQVNGFFGPSGEITAERVESTHARL